MRTILLILLIGSVARADVWVNGYYTKSGHYVQGHFRSSADSNPYNNYSSWGNTNPYTGHTGSHDPYKNLNTYSNDNENEEQ